MKHKRSALALLLACALAVAGATLPMTSSAKSAHRRPARAHLVVGLADSGYWVWSVHNLLRLHVPTARLVVPWNVVFMRDKTQLNYARQWLHGAQVNGVKPLVSFAYNGSYVPSDQNYTMAIKAFLHEFPWSRPTPRGTSPSGRTPP